MKIAVTGYYGFSNYGDELFILATKLGADRFWQRDEIFFIAPPTPNIHASFIVPSWFPKQLYRALNIAGRLSRLIFFSVASFKSDMILNAGGSTISSYAPSNKFYFELLFKKYFHKKLAGIGLSVGPFLTANDQEEALGLLKNFEFISTRDSASYEFIRQYLPDLPLYRASDLAGIVAYTYQFNKIQKGPSALGVSLMEIDTVDKTIDIHYVMNILIEFVKQKNMTVRIFILNNDPNHGDIQISEAFIVALKKENIKYESISLDRGALNVWEEIASCAMMVSYRLHGAITAYLSDVPFYLFEYHQKCSDFLAEVNHVNIKTLEKNGLKKFLQNPSYPEVPFHDYISLSLKNFPCNTA